MPVAWGFKRSLRPTSSTPHAAVSRHPQKRDPFLPIKELRHMLKRTGVPPRGQPRFPLRSAKVILLTASFAALGAGPVFADSTSGNGSLFGGNQVNAPISAPIDISGNGVAVAGSANAQSHGGSAVNNG